VLIGQAICMLKSRAKFYRKLTSLVLENEGGGGAKEASLCRRACGHGDKGTGPHQVLTPTLTLFQPAGGSRLYPPYTDVPT
jgi:hypothetical protein